MLELKQNEALSKNNLLDHLPLENIQLLYHSR